MRRIAVVALLCATGGFGQTRRLDTSNFIVMGEGLAAGMGDFGLHSTWQNGSFAARMAAAFNTIFPQPLIQAPGIGNPVGWPAQQARVPGRWQTSVRSGPASLFVFNLSIPGLRLSDAVSRPPRPPLVQPNDPLQTSINLILGFPGMALGAGKPLWTQLDYAVSMNPSLALVALGYTEACEAAVAGDAGIMPTTTTFRASYDRILSALAANFSELVVLTIPDPLDTAYFQQRPDGTFLAAPALPYLASGESPPAGSVISADAAARIRAAVAALNREISASAQSRNATVVDLRALFARWRSDGLTAGAQRLSASFQGGIYNFSGFYPGLTAHAAIANEILTALNGVYGQRFALVNLADVVRTDPAARYRPTTAAERIR